MDVDRLLSFDDQLAVSPFYSSPWGSTTLLTTLAVVRCIRYYETAFPDRVIYFAHERTTVTVTWSLT